MKNREHSASWRIAGMFLLSVYLSAPCTWACSCLPPPPPREALKQSAAVFAGRVVSVTKRETHHLIRFEVRRAWKGAGTSTLSVTTPTNSAACGYAFNRGGEYLVYAVTEKGRRGLSTNLCTRTKPLSRAKADLAALGAGKSRSAASAPASEAPRA